MVKSLGPRSLQHTVAAAHVSVIWRQHKMFILILLKYIWLQIMSQRRIHTKNMKTLYQILEIKMIKYQFNLFI